VVVTEQQAGSGIAGHIDIRPAVVIEIRGNRREAVSSVRLVYASGGCDIGECAVAVVATEGMIPIGQAARPTEYTLRVAIIRLSRARRRFHVERQIVRDEQVQFSVTVVIEKGTTGAKARLRTEQAGLFRDIGERTVAVIAVKRVLPPAGEENVFEPIVAPTTSWKP
jgi:hypothetical protein